MPSGMDILRRSFGIAVVLALMAVDPATAHDHKPPGATLRSGRVEQEGIRVTSCWIKGKELGGAAFCAQREMAFPEPVDTRATATISFETAREPSRVRVRAWRRLKPNGMPRRPSRRLEVVLEESKGAWEAAIDLPPRAGTWYLQAKGVWPDARFPDSKQFALWTFAVRTG